MNNSKFFIISFLIIILASFSVIAAETDNIFIETDAFENLRLGNDYVVIVSNMDENGLGRFAIETTGGAPLRSNDENKPLIYGRPKPWTSYTTIWLNDEKYVFGGETGKRAGKSGKYGKVIKGPVVEDNAIHTVTQINDVLLVEQILKIIKSTTTGLYDSVQIKYRINNISEDKQKVGLRIMLDTMLGQNDGAPFRIGKDAVTTDNLYYKKQLPEFWQAFDSISNPNVTSQGNFTGNGVTPPDKIYLSDWGSLADGVWDFDFNPGEEFLRKGEYEIDSAIAMYWIPEYVEPGESVSYITNYGLGGITIVPGLLSLGVTSPAEVIFDTPDKTFPIMVYVENTSEITAKNVKVKLNIPDSLVVETKEKDLGDLKSGDIAQVIWNVKASSDNIPPKIEYTVIVEADNTDSNSVKREVTFVGPPVLISDVKVVDDLKVVNGKLIPNPFTIEALIKNEGGSTLYDVSTELILPPGIVPASSEIYRKYPGDIAAGEKVPIRWKIKALQVEGKLPFAINVLALNGYNQILRFEDLAIPLLKPTLYFRLNQNEYKLGDYITVDLMGQNISEVDKIDLNINYNIEYLKLVHVSRGNVFLRDSQLLPWNRPEKVNEGLISFYQFIQDDINEGSLATLHFKVLKPGENKLGLQINKVEDSFRLPIEIIPMDYKFE